MSYSKHGLLNLSVLDDPARVRAAIAAGAKVNARDKSGNTPLRLTDNPQSMRALIEKLSAA